MAGSHRFRWNLRYPGYTDFEGRIFWAAGNYGPMAVPGTYRVRMEVDGQEVGTRDFDIVLDPRIEGVTQADLQARFDLALQIRDRVSEANEAVLLIRDLEDQILERLEDTESESLRTRARELMDALDAVEGEIYQVKNQSNQDPLNFPIKLNNKLAALMGVVESAENRPTEQSYTVFNYLSDLLQKELDRLETILDQDLPTLNEALEDEGLEPVEVHR